MRFRALTIVVAGAFLLVGSSTQSPVVRAATQASQSLFAKRATVAISYKEGNGTSIDMIGTALQPAVRGKAEVKRKDGRTRIAARMATYRSRSNCIEMVQPANALHPRL